MTSPDLAAIKQRRVDQLHDQPWRTAMTRIDLDALAIQLNALADAGMIPRELADGTVAEIRQNRADLGEMSVWKAEALESREEKARLRAKIAHIEASGPIHDLSACSEFVRQMTDEMLRRSQELKDMTRDRDAWFDAYNALRDQGSPSWDMFDATVGMTVSAIEDELTARREAMARVRDLCAKPTTDLIAKVFESVDALDMENGWHEVGMTAAQPVLVAVAQAMEMPEVRYT